MKGRGGDFSESMKPSGGPTPSEFDNVGLAEVTAQHSATDVAVLGTWRWTWPVELKVLWKSRVRQLLKAALWAAILLTLADVNSPFQP